VDLSRSKQARSQISAAFQDLPYKAAKELTLKDFNYHYISYLLKANHGNVTRAARQCGLERQALQQIMRRYAIKADGFRK
jgi:transcriptional regulator with GAF, ATPase, and Fis domain